MALTQIESSDLMNDSVFRGRVKVCAISYAQYLSLQAANSGARTRWIQQVFQAPDAVAQTLAPNVVMNPSVQADGGAISDPDLQAAVQTVADMVM